MRETLRKRRGHNFMPPKATLRRIPALLATDGVEFDDKIIWLHYFSPSTDYFIAEIDPHTGEAFGYAVMARHPEGAEWGYIPLPELEQATYTASVAGHEVSMVGVERDLHWMPVPFNLIKR